MCIVIILEPAAVWTYNFSIRTYLHKSISHSPDPHKAVTHIWINILPLVRVHMKDTQKSSSMFVQIPQPTHVCSQGILPGRTDTGCLLFYSFLKVYNLVIFRICPVKLFHISVNLDLAGYFKQLCFFFFFFCKSLYIIIHLYTCYLSPTNIS